MSDWMDADSRVERAHDLYCRGRWVEAAVELRAAISSNPCNPSWHFNLGLTLEALEDFKGAVECFSESIRLEPNDVEVLCRLGINLCRLDQYDNALECFEQAQKIDPNYEPSYCNRIILYTEKEDHDQAEVMFYLAQQLNDRCPLCFFNIGNSLYNRGKYSAAIDCWLKCLAIDPIFPQAHARIGDALWSTGNLEAALSEFRKEYEISEGQEIDPMIDLGELLIDMGRLDKAEKYLRQAIELENDNPDANYYLGQICEMQGQHDAAEYRFRKVHTKDSKYKGINFCLGKIALKAGDKRTALIHFKEELEVNNDDSRMIQQIGELLIQGKLLNLAYHAFARLVFLNPDNANSLHNLAVCCFMLNKMDEGITYCRKAIKLCNWYVLAMYNLALAYKCTGQEMRALAVTVRAFKTAPKDPNVKQLRKRLKLNNIKGYLKLRKLSRRK